MFLRKLILGIVWNFASFGAALFIPAGTIHWWRAWVLMGVLLVSTTVTMVAVLRTREGLLKERFKGIIQKGQPWVDRVILLAFVAAYGASLVLIPLDVLDYHLL